MRLIPSAAVAVLCATATVHAELHATNLRCESLFAPLGIDRPTPRLSWTPESDRPNESQTGYRILVATSPDALRRDAGDLWDSGDVKSDATFGIAYAGKLLMSGQRVWWKVRTADRDGARGKWSEPQSWSMGLLSPDDWRAKWVGFDAGRAATDAEPNPLADAQWIGLASDATTAPAGDRVFERTFTLPADAKVSSAELLVSADDRFKATLNGQPIGEGRNWKTPTALDLKSALRPGENVLRIVVTNETSGPTGLLAHLRWADAGGQATAIVTDGEWRVATSPDGTATEATHVLGKNGDKPWDPVDPRYLLPPAAYVRRGFTLDKPVRHATLYAASLGVADLYVNGRRASEDFFLGGWTDYAIRSYYRTYDVTDRVRAGANAIGAVVADGWYSGHVAFNRRRDWYGKHPRIRAQLDVEFADGTHQIVASDESWRASDGPTRIADMLAGESYDARAEAPGWSEPSFDEKAWRPVDVGAEVKPVVQAHPGQPVRAVKTYATKSVAQPKPGVYVVDFGQNLAGICRLSVKGKPGQTITLRHAERLNEDGTIYTENLRTARATDTYTCKGTGDVETWSPRFTFHGFQYVEVTGLDAPPTAETLTAIALTSDTPRAGSFECSDEMLNQLCRNIYQTQAMNFIDVPTDCPQRDERLGWTGDAQIYIRTATLNTDVHAFFDKWLVDLADQQRADGELPCTAPLRQAGGDDGGPAWADAGVICPWTIYDVYGDGDLLARQYPSMVKFVDFMVKRSTPEGLPPEKFHCFGDWLSIKADTPKDLIYVAYFAHDADLMARTATVLGKADDAKRYGELFETLKGTFRKSFVDDDGKIKGDTQCGYVLAIAFDLLDETGTAEAGRRLVADVEAKGDHLSTGFIGTKDLMLALDRVGRNDLACRLVHQDTFPSWGFSIRHGATSIWERWDGWTPEKGFNTPTMNSFAHYSFGAVYQWIAQSLGGIRNGGDAYKRIVIEPTFDPKLTFAKCGYASVRGPIATEWKRDGDRTTLTVTIPPNTTAVVRLPTTGDVKVSGAAAKDAATKDGRVELTAWSGTTTYEFEAK